MALLFNLRLKKNEIVRSLRYRKKYYFSKIDIMIKQGITRLLISDKRDMVFREKLYVWVPVWGDKHIKMFFDYTLPSLYQRNNLPSLSDYEVVLFIYTLDDFTDNIENGFLQFNPNIKYNLIVSSQLEYQTGDRMLDFLQDILKKCVNDKALMIVAQPDLIFSDGSISTAVKLSNGKGISIAAPHPRISYEGIEKTKLKEKLLSGGIVTSKELVKISLQNKHSTLEYANDLEDVNTTSSGISTRMIKPDSMAVIHNIPAVYVASPSVSDVKFFDRQVSFNTIDKVWPAHLLKEMRLKYIGSSDMFFCAELTNDTDRPGNPESGMKYNDKYSGVKPFLNCANTIISSWDGET